ncbi:nuclear mRNA splicing protein [Myxozyma melibiosi]|uniref:Nuclear mRNA splicing protein n=1 Tax=Myxozyma melibiosi TaxID=54550 RepID=A0ABR1F926_9ASCO
MPFPIYARSLPLKSHVGPVHVVKYNTTGQYILSGGQDKQILLWNPNSSKLIKAYHGVSLFSSFCNRNYLLTSAIAIQHGYEVLDISVSHDNAKFTSCGGDRTVFLWDVTSGSITRRFSGHSARVNSVAFNADASVVASASYDTTVRLWDLKASSAKPVQVLEEAKDSVSCVLIRGTQIITGSVDGFVRVYDLRKGQLQEDLIGHPVTSLQDSTDSATLLVSTLDNTIRLFDKSNGSLLQSFTGHKNSEYRARSCFGDNDVYVVSGSEDGRVFAWDLVSGRVVHELLAPVPKEAGGERKKMGNVVSCVTFHPKKAQMVSCSTAGLIQVWDSD